MAEACFVGRERMVRATRGKKDFIREEVFDVDLRDCLEYEWKEKKDRQTDKETEREREILRNWLIQFSGLASLNSSGQSSRLGT